MLLIKTSNDIHKYIFSEKEKNKKIGFVPTMGALHQGHLELILQSKKENDLTICSVFVNPTQFNDSKDFEKYPNTIEVDIEKLLSVKCDALFFPSVKEMYPQGFENNKIYDLGKIETLFEGEFRPGHFQGVCVVVHKLLDIVSPHNLYMGEKDFQQCAVISILLKIMNSEIKLHICPTLREKSGLAMSSRNARLSTENKEKAALIYKTLNNIKENKNRLSFSVLQKNSLEILASQNFETEYLKLINKETFSEMNEFDFSKKMQLLIATHFGGVRLIDNISIN